MSKIDMAIKYRTMKVPVYICALFIVSACTLTYESTDEYYSRRNLDSPNGDHILVCHGYSCYFKTAVHEAPIVEIFNSTLGNVANEEEERDSIGVAIAKIEILIGELVGTSSDEGGLKKIRVWGDPTQQDCIDETTNTMTYLLVAENAGLLTYHSVKGPVIKGNLLDFRWPHHTAVIKDKETDILWAVDSWVRDNGGPPDIMILDKWKNI